MENWQPLGKASKTGNAHPWIQTGYSASIERVYVSFLDGFGDFRLSLTPREADDLATLLISAVDSCVREHDPDAFEDRKRCPVCRQDRYGD